MKDKILVVWPPEHYVMPIHSKIPKRWAYLVEIISYLVKKFPEIEFEIMDCLNPKYSYAEILTKIAEQNFLTVMIVSRIEGVESIIKIIDLTKKIRPDQNILVYGDVCEYAPNFFKKMNINALVKSGDW